MDTMPQSATPSQTIPRASETDGATKGGPSPELLAWVGILQPHRVLIMGEGSLDVLCSLIRLGCAAAEELAPGERAEIGMADLVIARAPRHSRDLEHLLVQAHRALMPVGGRIALEVTGAALAVRVRHADSLLKDAGFESIRSLVHPNVAIVVGRLAGRRAPAL